MVIWLDGRHELQFVVEPNGLAHQLGEVGHGLHLGLALGDQLSELGLDLLAILLRVDQARGLVAQAGLAHAGLGPELVHQGGGDAVALLPPGEIECLGRALAEVELQLRLVRGAPVLPPEDAVTEHAGHLAHQSDVALGELHGGPVAVVALGLLPHTVQHAGVAQLGHDEGVIERVSLQHSLDDLIDHMRHDVATPIPVNVPEDGRVGDADEELGVQMPDEPLEPGEEVLPDLVLAHAEHLHPLHDGLGDVRLPPESILEVAVIPEVVVVLGDPLAEIPLLHLRVEVAGDVGLIGEPGAQAPPLHALAHLVSLRDELLHRLGRGHDLPRSGPLRDLRLELGRVDRDGPVEDADNERRVLRLVPAQDLLQRLELERVAGQIGEVVRLTTGTHHELLIAQGRNQLESGAPVGMLKVQERRPLNHLGDRLLRLLLEALLQELLHPGHGVQERQLPQDLILGLIHYSFSSSVLGTGSSGRTCSDEATNSSKDFG